MRELELDLLISQESDEKPGPSRLFNRVRDYLSPRRKTSVPNIERHP